jgi:hypothetical protein
LTSVFGISNRPRRTGIFVSFFFRRVSLFAFGNPLKTAAARTYGKWILRERVESPVIRNCQDQPEKSFCAVLRFCQNT